MICLAVVYRVNRYVANWATQVDGYSELWNNLKNDEQLVYSDTVAKSNSAMTNFFSA